MVSNSIGNLTTKLIMLSLGLLFLLPPAFKLYNYCLFRSHAVSVDGVITDAVGGGDMGGTPFVEYKDLQGNSYERKSKAKTHWFFAPKIGEKIKVFYDESDPTIAIVANTFHYVALPVCFIVAGMSCIVIAVRDRFTMG